jgi:glycosyltransferase involved in cell wall biosynthesis
VVFLPNSDAPPLTELFWEVAQRTPTTFVRLNSNALAGKILALAREHASRGTPRRLTVGLLHALGYALAARVRQLAEHPRALIFTQPTQAFLAPAFRPDKRIYYVIDDFGSSGYGWPVDLRARWEQELLGECDQVFVVSNALAQLFRARYRVKPGALVTTGNGVTDRAIPKVFPPSPAPFPEDLSEFPRPVAGVMGRISSRLRLDWIAHASEALPWLTWLFAGGVETRETLPRDRPLLERLLQHPRCHVLGSVTYPEMICYAASVDVGVVPYSERSVNFCASPMRFFMHLCYGQPILTTPGCAQLKEFAPLAKECDTPATLVRELESLRERNFEDGQRLARWQAAKDHSWARRAEFFLRTIDGFQRPRDLNR